MDNDATCLPNEREMIVPLDESEWLRLRTKDVTSTEVSALFGCSPYMTHFELWHRKKDASVIQIEPTERMIWGTRLQDSIARGIAEDQGWEIRRMNEYVRLPDFRIGSSFDFAIDISGILEVKNIDSLAFRDGWIVEGDSVEAPPHIEFQVQHQLAVTGRIVAYIGALVGGNRLVLVKREPNEKVISAIKEKSVAFWRSVERGEEPQPDFLRDAAIISKLYSYAKPGKIISVQPGDPVDSLVAEYQRIGEDVKKLESRREVIKAELLTKIGDAEKVLGETFTISASVAPATHVSFDRKEFRSLRIYMKRPSHDK